MTTDIISAFVAAFVTLFIVIDPIMVTPIFATLARSEPPKRQRRIALEAAFIAACILTFFGIAGNFMLHHLGISIDAFRTAGGILLFLMGFRMFFEPDGELEAKTPGPKASSRENIAFFPLAIPLMAGPGAIATMMLLTDVTRSWPERGAAFGAAYCVLISGVIIMAFAGKIADALGRTGMNVISRLLGMLLMALSTQYIFDGIRVGMFEKIAAPVTGH